MIYPYFATTICHFARCITLKVKLFFIYHFLPRLSTFADSYYSPCGPCGPLGIKPGRFYHSNAKFWAECKYQILRFWYASAAYQARLVSPWVFWLNCVSPKYELWLDRTRQICRRRVPKRYD